MYLLMQLLRNSVVRDEKGASAVEYTVLVALIIVVIVAAIATLGQTLLGVWQGINTAILGG